MQQPRVSVIVPNYNHAAFLPERIDSILAQSYPLYEGCEWKEFKNLKNDFNGHENKLRFSEF